MAGRRFRPRAAKGKQKLLEAINKINLFGKAKSGFCNSNNSNNNNNTIIRPSTESIVRPDTPDIMTGMRVSVSVRFEAPIDMMHHHVYDASPEFVGSDMIFEGLEHRIEHISRELITRPDLNAEEPFLNSAPYVKQGRYHLIFRIHREGQVWKERYFTSFQEQPLTTQEAHEVILETDRMIALYMAHHDRHFVWLQPPILEGDRLRHTTSQLAIGSPQDMCCIPSYSGQPAYSIVMDLKSQHGEMVRNWQQKFDSTQPTPLTLFLGEKLMSSVNNIIRRAVAEREAVFQERHMRDGCYGLEGSYGCHHFQEGAFSLSMKINNNFGPEQGHLETKVTTFRVLFCQDEDEEYEAWVRDLITRVDRAKAKVDRIILGLDDLTITINEMGTHEWVSQNPMTLSLDSSECEDRKRVENILQRLRTGVKHVLRGHGAEVLITVHKRGHLILDQVIRSGPLKSNERMERFDSDDHMQEELIGRLEDQIKTDIWMVCKDTIYLGPSNMGTPAIRVVTPTYAQHNHSQYETQSQTDGEAEAQRHRQVSSDSYTPAGSPPQNIGILDPEEYFYMADAISERSDDLVNGTPSLADVDSIESQADPITPVFPPAEYTGHSSGFADVSAMSNEEEHHETFVSAQEDSVLHHTAHMGLASRQLHANIGEDCSIHDYTDADFVYDPKGKDYDPKGKKRVVCSALAGPNERANCPECIFSPSPPSNSSKRFPTSMFGAQNATANYDDGQPGRAPPEDMSAHEYQDTRDLDFLLASNPLGSNPPAPYQTRYDAEKSVVTVVRRSTQMPYRAVEQEPVAPQVAEDEDDDFDWDRDTF